MNGGIIENINGDFISNSAGSYGGAIYNCGTISTLTGNFINNSVACGFGGAIANYYTIGEIVNSSFIDNHSANKGGAIYTSSDLNFVAKNGFTSQFKGNYTDNNGETDYNAIFVDNSNDVTLNFTMQNGGKFYMQDSIKSNGVGLAGFLSDNNVNTFEEYAKSLGYNDDPLEYFFANYACCTLEEMPELYGSIDEYVKSMGYETLDDMLAAYGVVGDSAVEIFLNNEGYDTPEDYVKAQGYRQYSVNIQGDDVNNTMFYLLNDIVGADVTIGNTTLNTINNQAHNYNFNTLTLSNDVNMVADVDLAASAMDRLSAATYGDHGENKLNVVGMNLLSDSKTDVTSILFADQGLKDNVATTLASAPDSEYQTKVYTPIYQYRVKYDNRDDAGYFVFDRSVPGKDDNTGGNSNANNGGGNGGSNASDAFNPAVLSSAVSSVAGAQATINETFKYTFAHADAFTQLPYAERTARMNANKYALSTDFNHNLGALCPEHNNMSAWFKPYVTFESMDLRNGPRVNAKTYGSLAGFDTNFRELKRGWHSVGTGYVGYNGSQLSYSGVSTSMNGGLAGYTETFYKKNFWTAITLTAGASVGESHTMYGKEDFTTLMAGVGSKTGYNFEFKEGKYIIQPIMFMSYTFAKTFDYTNAAGVHVKPGAAHSLQLNPSVRFIANTKGGWQPYASVGMVWNVMNENKVVANDVRLPEMGMKPYVEYGVGLQRNWKDKFTAYGQAMLRNGGRNGIALTAGFRWAIGHEGEPIEKVQNSDKTRTVLKQLTPSQRWAQQKHTTRTTKTATLKQLN